MSTIRRKRNTYDKTISVSFLYVCMYPSINHFSWMKPSQKHNEIVSSYWCVCYASISVCLADALIGPLPACLS